MLETDATAPGQPTVKVPRANCIFEAGLFIGAFGGTERCLVLTSTRNNLPTDLDGQKLTEFEEPANFNNPVQCLNAIKPFAEIVRKRAEDLGSRSTETFTVLSIDQLMSKEKQGAEARPARFSTVLVRESQPPELSFEYADIVRDNLQYGIDYHYLFDLKTIDYRGVARLLLSLAVSDLVDKAVWKHSASEDHLREFLDGRPTEINRNLQKMKQRLFVGFVPFEAFEEFCIHNAQGGDHAKGYLKLATDKYIELPAHKTKPRAAFYNQFTHQHKKAIFDVNNQYLKEARTSGLEAEILDAFPQKVRNTIRKVCFGV